MSAKLGASAKPTGLGSADAPEPHAGLGPSGAIPSAKFTARPWDVDTLRMVYAPGSNVAQVLTTNGDYETSNANARLIAAAPELYEALIQLAIAYHALHVTRDIDPAQSVALRYARKALAKARGDA